MGEELRDSPRGDVQFALESRVTVAPVVPSYSPKRTNQPRPAAPKLTFRLQVVVVPAGMSRRPIPLSHANVLMNAVTIPAAREGWTAPAGRR